MEMLALYFEVSFTLLLCDLRSCQRQLHGGNGDLRAEGIPLTPSSHSQHQRGLLIPLASWP